LTLDKGKKSATRAGQIIPGERTRGNHWIRGWVNPRDGLDAAAKRKIPAGESNPVQYRGKSLYW